MSVSLLGTTSIVSLAAEHELLVSGWWSNNVGRFDGDSGDLIDIFVPSGSGGLEKPPVVRVGPDGHLYVPSHFGTPMVLRFDGMTGAVLDTFVTAHSAGLQRPDDALFGPDGNLYVSWFVDDMVCRYDGQTGAFVDTFVTPGSGGLVGAATMIFNEDQDLLICSFYTNEVKRYDGATGDFIDTFVESGHSLVQPETMTFRSNGNLLVPSFLDRVNEYDRTTGEFVGAFIEEGAGGLQWPQGIANDQEDDLYVGSGTTDQIYRFDGQTGDFMDVFVEGGQGVSGISFIAFRGNPAAAVEEVNVGALTVTSVQRVYPNPSSSRHIIEIYIAPEQRVGELMIVNAVGRVVWRQSLDGLGTGRQRVIWNGLDLAGNPAPSSVYFLRLPRLDAGSETGSGFNRPQHKVMLLR